LTITAIISHKGRKTFFKNFHLTCVHRKFLQKNLFSTVNILHYTVPACTKLFSKCGSWRSLKKCHPLWNTSQLGKDGLQLQSGFTRILKQNNKHAMEDSFSAPLYSWVVRTKASSYQEYRISIITKLTDQTENRNNIYTALYIP